MWAPDCIERNGKYYFYFPSAAKDTVTYGRGFTVGVAVADKPEGPYTPQPTPIKGIRGIDPNIFIDDDKTPYLIFGQNDVNILEPNATSAVFVALGNDLFQSAEMGSKTSGSPQLLQAVISHRGRSGM
jgi:beta-xylosidase